MHNLPLEAPVKELLTIPEAMEYLSCSLSTLNRLLAEAAFRFTWVRKTRRVFRSSIDEYLSRLADNEEKILIGPVNCSRGVKSCHVDLPGEDD